MEVMTSFWWKFWESVRWDVPKVVLAVLLFGFIYAVWKVQQRPDFDFAQLFMDDKVKHVSAGKFISMGTWIVGTWIVMQDALDGVSNETMFMAYIGFFGGYGVASKVIDKWKGGG